MAVIWRREGEDWRALGPSGFPSEEALHDLIAASPHLLPLSGDPSLVVVGREVAVGTGYADLLAVEPDGRVAILEIKLRRNAEARRAVVAQVLTYAAYLKGLTVGDLEDHVLRRHLDERGFASLSDAARENDQSGSFDTAGFEETLSETLAAGQFRLVLVLDEAPSELVQLVGYLESITQGITVDLVTVAAFGIGDEEILVPQRVDPEYEAAQVEPAQPAQRRKKMQSAIDGSDAFVEAAARASREVRPSLERLVAWAQELEAQGHAELKTYIGQDREILLVWVRGDKGGLASVWNDNGAALQLWRSVFVRRAPESIPLVEELLGKPIGQGNTVRDPSDELLAAVADAYRAAGQAAPEWNQRDFYVSFGVEERRSWADARKYGFVSAGGGAWYSRSLQQLKPGNRVFVYIPKGNGVGGYVGVGEVTGEARPVRDFTVEVGGRQVPILDLPLDAERFDEDAGDPEMSEWLVPVRWIRDLDPQQAIKDPDFFANQNSAVRMTHRYTLEKLTEEFRLDRSEARPEGA